MKNLFKLSNITKFLIFTFLFMITITTNNVFASANTKKVTAVNGKITVTFSNVLVTTPKISDFVVTQNINKGATKTIKSTKVAINSTKKIVTLTIPVITKSSETKSVVYKVSYKKDTGVISSAVVVAKIVKTSAKESDKATATLTTKSIYQDMINLKEKYPEGMPWTNDNYYRWNGGIYSGGYGCAGFVFLLSDAAFGELPTRKHDNFGNIRVGDIVRINNDTHSVIVLSIDNNGITVAEGNYNSSIHWGRMFTPKQMVEVGNYIMTRYPQ